MPEFQDTPAVTVRPDDDNSQSGSRIQRIIGSLSLLGAMVFTVGSLVLLILPQNEPVTDTTPVPTDAPALVEAETDVAPTFPPTMTANMVQPVVTNMAQAQLPPVAEPASLMSLLQVPLSTAQARDDDVRNAVAYNPYTIIDNTRERSEFIEYTVVQGDTINSIAQRYGLTQESIAWCNDRRIILVLRPGDTLRIPPTDGACHQVLGTREETVEDIAEQYNIDDPYTILESQANPQLFGRAPTDILPGGNYIFIPGGEGELITWNPGVDKETNADGSVRSLSFAPGQAGSCGNVQPSGGAFWVNPLPNGTWIRGFFAGHTGVDIAASTGTPIVAANSGYVLFSGYSKWGYGEAIVIEHGPVTSTLYGHMSVRFAQCGQWVDAGTVIGQVGSTGNSSGPHLHFEIRSNNQPTDPTVTIPF